MATEGVMAGTLVGALEKRKRTVGAGKLVAGDEVLAVGVRAVVEVTFTDQEISGIKASIQDHGVGMMVLCVFLSGTITR